MDRWWMVGQWTEGAVSGRKVLMVGGARAGGSAAARAAGQTAATTTDPPLTEAVGAGRDLVARQLAVAVQVEALEELVDERR